MAKEAERVLVQDSHRSPIPQQSLYAIQTAPAFSLNVILPGSPGTGTGVSKYIPSSKS